MTTMTTGSVHHGFLLEHREEIPEIHSTVSLFTHTVLGCQVLAIKNNDPNKTFCVSFMTVPEDSTGVAHILEHSVLMGSKKYPVKDVFGEIPGAHHEPVPRQSRRPRHRLCRPPV